MPEKPRETKVVERDVPVIEPTVGAPITTSDAPKIDEELPVEISVKSEREEPPKIESPPKQGMTRNEKLTALISTLALIMAIASPFIAYYWLDPQLQALQNRGRLKVRSFEQEFIAINRFAINENGELYVKKPEEVSPKITNFGMAPWGMDIENIGNLPAKQVVAVLTFPDIIERDSLKLIAPGVPDVSCQPPIPFEIKEEGRRINITFKGAIPAGEKVTLYSGDMPARAWVANEFGEGIAVETPIAGIVIFVNRDGTTSRLKPGETLKPDVSVKSKEVSKKPEESKPDEKKLPEQ